MLLPGRENWVLSRKVLTEKEMRVFRSLDEIKEHLLPKQNLFIIGGGEIYSLALPLCHELFLTEVKQKFWMEMPFSRNTNRHSSQ